MWKHAPFHMPSRNCKWRPWWEITTHLLEQPIKRETAEVWHANNTEWWWVCGATGTLVHCWWDCKLVQPLWKTVWRVLTKLIQCPIFFQIGKGLCQGCILSPCLFNLYAEYFMWNTGLGEHKLESRLLEEISITSDMQMTPPLWQKVKRN